jgi:DNA-3-methyladenine glycosylase I
MENTPLIRCPWATSDPLYISYHDTEWGRPLHDDQKLFELLCLEGQQAGLSWITVLKKRENYRKAFQNFSPSYVAQYNAKKVDELLQDSGIIRNTLKINSIIQNAQSFLKIQNEFKNFDLYIWQFVDGKPIVNHWERLDQIPAKTDISDAMSKDLKKRGFNFVGSTICYAFMQAAGLVNDHITSCFCYKELV